MVGNSIRTIVIDDFNHWWRFRLYSLITDRSKRDILGKTQILPHFGEIGNRDQSSVRQDTSRSLVLSVGDTTWTTSFPGTTGDGRPNRRCLPRRRVLSERSTVDSFTLLMHVHREVRTLSSAVHKGFVHPTLNPICSERFSFPFFPKRPFHETRLNLYLVHVYSGAVSDELPLRFVLKERITLDLPTGWVHSQNFCRGFVTDPTGCIKGGVIEFLTPFQCLKYIRHVFTPNWHSEHFPLYL